MMKDITLGQYFPGDSLIHRADPRVKIVLTLVIMTNIFLIDSYLAFAVFSGFIVMTIFIAGIPFGYTLKGVKPIMPIIVFTALVNIFTAPGTVLLGYGAIRITYEGIDTAVKMSVRLILLIMSSSIMTLTTTPISLTDGLERLLGPLKRLKVPVHEFSMMMTVALRSIPTLLEETDKIMKAQASRGADFETGNIFDRAKSFIPVLIPLFVSAFRRADDLALAMEARCYRGGEGRTRMKRMKLSGVDFRIILFFLVFEVVLIYVQYFRLHV
ncbi:MAG TPA: energy-coupling factor transporter transmembrane component T [Acetivibrio sp.]|uniref:energy-coupling factor transporter transmembrane component T family protein n=1 Tax=Acetivibrio sp. TaxID=1872092 RepID=UPI002CDD2C3D|nr:energy-coupling factor transporter transmembrane component T [Acetivibrio sp.]HOM02972.1 energy-coupling factor transporter transmembrane component T [Acetivibrio sp.]